MFSWKLVFQTLCYENDQKCKKHFACFIFWFLVFTEFVLKITNSETVVGL